MDYWDWNFIFAAIARLSWLRINIYKEWNKSSNYCLAFKGGGAAWHRDSILASQPAALGSNPGSPEIFSLYFLVCEQYGDRTHLCNGYHKM